MNILVACEESQVVCTAFRKKGHIAFSCDLQRCSGGHPEWHIICDVLSLLDGNCSFTTCTGDFYYIQKWDLIIAHPPCTFLAKSGSCNIPRDLTRIEKGFAAADFFMKIYNCSCEKICIENPVPLAIFNLPKRSQAIQPYQFDIFNVHPYSKRTYLWLKNLPFLSDSTPFGFPIASWCDLHYSAKIRSKTFIGVAAAMAEQWG